MFSCSKKQPQIHIIHGNAQGSTYTIKYVSDSDIDLKPAIDSILEVIDLSMSTYREESIISRVNAGDSTLVVDAHFINVFNKAQEVWKASNGLFDPTVGVLVNAWGFGPQKGIQPPSPVQIDSLLDFVGFDKVVLTDKHTIAKRNPFVSFDFNAIAQGYTVDVISDYLLGKNINDFITEVGGEMIAMGKNTVEDKDWIIGIDDPLQRPEERSLIAKIRLQGKGMATSGNYRKVIIDSVTGQQYVHTINPITGYTQRSTILSVTVLSNTCMEADAYATAFMVMGVEDVIGFSSQHPELELMLFYADSDNIVQQYVSDGFKNLVVP